ncbi:MAG: MMPL family transporter [Eubacteriales bacterium]
MKKKLILAWVIILIWVSVSASLFKLMPDVGSLVLEKGQPSIPESYSYRIAQKLAKEYDNYDKDSTMMSILVVFNEKDTLTKKQMGSIKTAVEKLISDSDKLGIKQVLTHFNNAALAKQFISSDKTTVFISVSIEKQARSIDEISNSLKNELSGTPVPHYITGADFIMDANVKTTLGSVQKTEILTGIIIFIILLLVFRSPVAPVISLITIALTFLTSMGIVTQLVDKFNFPFAVSTQSFLILVLFGIGTDYSLLLMTRFKEEMAKMPVDEAIKSTYKNSGKTILFSSLTVLIGFGVLWLAKFSVYRAGAAVAIGVGILIIALFTLLRSFMEIFGHKMFWPEKKKSGHKESLIWGKLTGAATSHPFISLIIIIALIVPVLFFQNSSLSYDSLKEISPEYEAMKAINIISDKFGNGLVSPVTIYIKNDTKLNSSEKLGGIDKITDALKKVEGVDKVIGVTQPESEKVKELYLNGQITAVADGLEQANTGIKKIMNGLAYANKQLKAQLNFSDISSFINLGDIINIKVGIPLIDNLIKNINSELSKAIMNFAKEKMSGSLDGISKSLTQLEDGLSQSVNGLKQISDGIDAANAYLKTLPESNNGKVFYIPAEQIMGSDFKKSIDNFMSSNYKITRIIVTLKANPYTQEAMDTVGLIDSSLKDSLKGSGLGNATYGIDGSSSMNKDLKAVSSGDFNRSVLLMLIGIGIILIFLSKSFFKALTIIISLLIANYSTLTITGIIFKDLLHVGNLSWTVPFFSFIMIVALGVDYSIFYIMRFSENRKLVVKTALVKSSLSVGSVVISAAFILSGTFAALYPANVPTLIELATVVIIGLFLLAFVLLPLFVPAAIMIIEKIEALMFEKKYNKSISIENEAEAEAEAEKD